MKCCSCFPASKFLGAIIINLISFQSVLSQNVGIGTTTPTSKLEVAGDVKVNGRIQNVSNPIDPQDAATKYYVDQISELWLNAGLNGIVTDVDGNSYKTIKLGSQVWMAENLRTTLYNNGTVIPKVTANAAWGGLTTPAWCWFSNDSTLYAKQCGALYNYYSVADTNDLNVCPEGWHVPTHAEFTILSDFLTANGYGFGGSGVDIGKSMATTYNWSSSATAGHVGNDLGTNNSCKYNAYPAGIRLFDGSTFINNSLATSWWSSSQSSTTHAFYRGLIINQNFLLAANIQKNYGHSVRCLRN